MAATQPKRMPTDKFLTLSINLLNKALLEASRTDAKALYRELSEGQVLPLTRVQMEDKSEVRFDLTLDHSEYRGRLNFGAFRESVTLLVASIADALRAQKPVKVFTAEHDPNIVLFGVTAVTLDNQQPSVMVLGADSSSGRAVVQLQLMYLSHGQFVEQTADANLAGEGQDTV